ncbi:MAG: RtcB family protein [Deltaproteobacteria bacterium]|nr:RtcB family protein [Deltaproteobacteria bacterium]
MRIKLEKIDDNRWIIPKTGSMRVPGMIFSSQELIDEVLDGESITQVANVSTLPGIVGYSIAMPDIHWGYGFPIGGVAAFRMEDGIVSPGGVGYDINCGCRLMTTGLMADDIKPMIRDIVLALYRDIPLGVGKGGEIRLSKKEGEMVATLGASWATKQGYGNKDDLIRTEERGVMSGADPDLLSERAVKRGVDQLGTLGSGNHFLEIQVVDEIYDSKTADLFNLHKGGVTLFLHTGSRGFGHQICDDFLKRMSENPQITGLPDRQLACAPIESDAGKRYLAAMACAANYAWANRQVLMHLAHESMMKALGTTPVVLRMSLLYDVSHNIVKMEQHNVDNRKALLCVHRKGATRAFPPGHETLLDIFRETGQPVLIPGDMGTCSYVLAGDYGSMDKSFGSSCHGAGRTLSRSIAIKKAQGRSIQKELEEKGIFVQAGGRHTLKEEMPEAYKDVSKVVDAVHNAGLARKIARLRPLGVIKG